jgi:hypothetical protein
MMHYAFDLESEQGDEATIRALHDSFVKPAPPGAFDPSQVAVGNLKDPAKIDAKIEDAKLKHQQAVLSYASDCEAAEQKYWADIFAKAALSPATGRIVVVGVKSAGGVERFISGDEPDILSAWWARWEELMGAGAKFLGANIVNFDLPYLVRRSWINGIPVPGAAWDGRYWHKSFVDVRQQWLLGQRWADCPSSLDHMAKVLGFEGKLPGEIAAHFGRYWREQREVAEAYLRRDLDLTLGIARRLGIIRERAA